MEPTSVSAWATAALMLSRSVTSSSTTCASPPSPSICARRSLSFSMRRLASTTAAPGARQRAGELRAQAAGGARNEGDTARQVDAVSHESLLSRMRQVNGRSMRGAPHRMLQPGGMRAGHAAANHYRRDPHDPRRNPGPVRPARSDGIRRGGGGRRPRRPGHRDPPEAAGGRARQGSLGRGAGEGLRARRAHPLGRHHGPARAERADPRLEGQGRAAEPAGDRRRLPVPGRERRRAHAQLPAAAELPATTATTSSAWPTSRAGWRSRPRAWAWRSSPAFRPPKCSTTRTARSRAWPPATWASARTASRPRTSSSAWSCMPSTRSSPKARAATWAGS